MFEVYKKEIEIEGKTYELRPLTGRFLPKLYSVLKSMSTISSAKEDEDVPVEEIFAALDEQTVGSLHSVIFETFKKSYPNTKPEELDEWVSQNLMVLMGPVLEVNLNSKPAND